MIELTNEARVDGEPARPQRAKGETAVALQVAGGRTRLRRLRQEGCLKLRFPRSPVDPLEAVLINTAGGLTGGDELAQGFTLEPGTSVTVTTQAAERVYRAVAGRAVIETRAEIGEGASLFWFPQETILFQGGALGRSLQVDARASSRFVLSESLVLGREAMGESVTSGLFRDRWRVRRDGRLVFADDLRLEGDLAGITNAAAGLAGNRALATVLAQGMEADLDALRAIVGQGGGVGAFDGLVVARLVAPSGFLLRKRLVPLLAALAKGALPRLWWS